MKDFELTEISGLRDILALGSIQVQPEQRRFTRNLFITYLQTRHPAVTTYRIDADGTPIGYVMLIHAENPTQWIIERLTIDADSQRNGWGYTVADHLIDMVHDFENSEMVIARYRPENDAARSLFAKLNFVEREEKFRGRHIAILEFEFEADEDDDEDVTDDDDDSADDDDDFRADSDETEESLRGE